MKSDVLLIPVTDDLLPAVLAVENESFSDPWSLSSLRECAASERMVSLAAVREDAVLGFGILGVAADESEVLDIAVSPDARGCGIGKGLLAALLAEAKSRGAAACYLEVRESNVPAIGLYTSFGFRTVGRRKNYYQKPREDALLMALALETEDSHADLSD